MLNPFRSGHIRTRLTFWYVALLAGILLVYAAGSSALLWWDLGRELDRHAVQDLETVEGLIQVAPDGHLWFNENYHNHPESKRVLERLLEVRSPDGRVLLRNERLGGMSLGGPPFAGEGVGGYSPRAARLADGSSVRLFSRRHNIGKIPVVIRLAYGQEPVWKPSRQFLLDQLITFPFTLLLAGIAGYVLAKRALSPVADMIRTAAAITPDRLRDRIPQGPADDELADLARVFNQMLDRIERAFEQLRRFTSDASHELRTPLTAMRSVGEVALRKNASPAEYRDVIGSMLEEAGRLTQLAETLLTVSRAEAGQIPLHLTRFSPLRLVQETVTLLDVLAEEKEQKLTFSGDPELSVAGDWVLARQALVNIVHNAVRHTPAGGEISVRVERSGTEWVSVRVADSGPGIPPEHAERIFDRFYRVDDSRNAQAGGAGLGLSIAKWAIEAQRGSLTLESRPAAGCTFVLRFPC